LVLLEQEKIRNENELLQKRVEAMESAVRIEQLYTDAIAAMRSYGGHPPLEMEDADADSDVF
jgi:hypothetical protein